VDAEDAEPSAYTFWRPDASCGPVLGGGCSLLRPGAADGCP